MCNQDSSLARLVNDMHCGERGFPRVPSAMGIMGDDAYSCSDRESSTSRGVCVCFCVCECVGDVHDSAWRNCSTRQDATAA